MSSKPPYKLVSFSGTGRAFRLWLKTIKAVLTQPKAKERQ